MNKVVSGLARGAWSRLPSLRALTFRNRLGRVMFLAINGAGLGHLTRCLAIADRLRVLVPESEMLFLTTSIAVPLVHQAGYQCHYIPSYNLMASAVRPTTWNRHFFHITEEVIHLHRPQILVFDGVMPYLGLRRVLKLYRRRLGFVWVRRQSFKPHLQLTSLRAAESLFDRVIVPTEWGEALDLEATSTSRHVRRVAPVLLLDRDAALSRVEALKSMSLELGRPVCYVQLGAGNINQIGDLESTLIEWLQDLGFRVVHGRSPIALRRMDSSPADRVITDFPNARYFNAFDLAVLAGGYNSVNEAIAFGLPAIFIPNAAARADDQVRRCMNARSFGRFEVLEDVTRDTFLEAVERLRHPAARVVIDRNSPGVSGAVQAAEVIHELMRASASFTRCTAAGRSA